MFNDISCNRKGDKDECLANAGVVKSTCEKIWCWTMVIYWTRFWKEVVFCREQSHKEPGIILRSKCCWNLQKADILLSEQQLHCPGVSSRAKDVENCRYTSPQMILQLTQFFALFFLSISSVSTEQWQLYVKNFESHQDGSGEPEILMGQSIVLGKIKAEVPLQNEDSMNESNFMAAIHSTSWIAFTKNKVSKFCKDYACCWSWTIFRD